MNQLAHAATFAEVTRTLSCKPWRIDIEAKRRNLETELKSLAA